QACAPHRERGISVLVLWVRGYPGSMIDMRDINRDGFGWITSGLDVAGRAFADVAPWIYLRAIGDVVLALRALESFGLPIAVRGESFGGGLATAAIALATTRVDRLVLGLPTMGDWPFRLRHTPGHVGIGHELDEALRRSGTRREDLEHRLRLADSCLHAPNVRVPTLCKLAARDDVVPAPTAAAVFNALGSCTSHKWRFVVPYGHFDGGLRNARRHALFERCAADFLDPDVTPTQGMITWEDQCSERPA
ncbi:MAG: acetylxylan esterase, partial [Phycisphaerales bacterium]|nr:acetylxylan esterase [Phycisphaerales bacterium]